MPQYGSLEHATAEQGVDRTGIGTQQHLNLEVPLRLDGNLRSGTRDEDQPEVAVVVGESRGR